jgi:alpha-tubulin suppressor-like RCC1 family protein
VEGYVWSVGDNKHGQLGLGDKQNRTLPEQITSLPTIIAIAAEGYNSLFLDVEGYVWSVGDNKHGQLGLGDIQERTSPEKITRLPPIMLPKGKVATKSARNTRS